MKRDGSVKRRRRLGRCRLEQYHGKDRRQGQDHGTTGDQEEFAFAPSGGCGQRTGNTLSNSFISSYRSGRSISRLIAVSVGRRKHERGWIFGFRTLICWMQARNNNNPFQYVRFRIELSWTRTGIGGSGEFWTQPFGWGSGASLLQATCQIYLLSHSTSHS